MGWGSGPPPHECGTCVIARRHEERRWAPESVIEAMQVFARETGRPPNAGEWAAPRDPRYPPLGTVQREFGRWSNAIRAAGLVSVQPSYPTRAEAKARRAVIADLFQSGMPACDIARKMHVNSSTVYWHLQVAGLWGKT